MKKHVFIINPEAGKKKASELIGYIEENFLNAVIIKTEYANHATELAKTYASPDTIIYSVGGDGTLNEVVNGVLLSKFAKDTFIASVPCGSGNDFIKSFTTIKNPVSLLEKYKKQKTKTIDVGYINGRSFINISSIGFDAEIVVGAKKYKKIPLINGGLAYLISVFATIMKLKAYSVKVSIDGKETYDKKALFIIMANGKYYGGGMKAAPKAELDDGLFEFCIVDKIPRRRVPILLPKFMKGKHETLKEIKTIRGKKITISSKKPLPLNIDGEVELSDHVEVYIQKEGINLLVP